MTTSVSLDFTSKGLISNITPQKALVPLSSRYHIKTSARNPLTTLDVPGGDASPQVANLEIDIKQEYYEEIPDEMPSHVLSMDEVMSVKEMLENGE